MIPYDSTISAAGMGKSGKSYLIKNHFIKNMKLPKGAIIAVFDPNGEYKKTREDMEITVPSKVNPAIFNMWVKENLRRGKVFMVCDEAALYLPKTLNIQKFAYITDFITRARFFKCGGILASRRFALLPTTFVALSDFVYLFRMFCPADLRAAREYLHGWRDLPTLKRGWFYQFSDKGEKLCPPIR